MATRRDLLKLGLVAGGAGLLHPGGATAQHRELIKFLCPPDDRPRELDDQPASPPARPFVAELFVPPVMPPVPSLDPPPDPQAHQRYQEFLPQKLYEIHETEFIWQYHPDPPYASGSYSWGFQAGNLPPSTPGPTYQARYGEPVLVRRVNNLPTVGHANVFWALPSTTSHLHNGHTASESDGNPVDWIDSGEFWDHHYANFPAGFNPLEKLTTLWYHDHRLDFTAANVYAGLAGFYLLFDEDDTGDETTGWRLPSFPQYDIPLLFQDIKFKEADGGAQVVFDAWNTDGMLGDRMTVNRRITPFFRVEARKYRFRMLNGGPSRFYELFLRSDRKVDGTDTPPFIAITGDGNFLPQPVVTQSLFLAVGQRADVILDFSHYRPGDHVYLHNLLAQTNGAGPSGARLDFADPQSFLMRFDVVEAREPDRSRIPDYFRPLPAVDLSEVRRYRTWTFDYQGGLWTINSRVMDPNRIDAGIDQNSAEIWTFRNGGRNWSHPIHSHFVEFLLLEVNGRPYKPTQITDIENRELTLVEYFQLSPERRKPIQSFFGGKRRDIAVLLPEDEVKVYMRWPDFLGKYVMHCHNVVHEDHAMMIRWDIVEPGKGFDTPRDVPAGPPHVEERPASPTIQDSGEGSNDGGGPES
ncbi:MAG TPA: multicopper oxidase domain-containing protein [Thermoanaerobaculia bacterium]